MAGVGAGVGAGKLAVVFGGSGFIGRNVVRELAKRGWRVRVAVRRPHHALFLRPMGVVGQVQLVQANVRDRRSVAEAVKGADAVVNLVGLLTEDGRQRFDNVQAQGAATVAECAKAVGVSTFVQMSAIGAGPESPSRYARAKAEGERAVRAAIPTAVILRPSVVFGPEDGFFNRLGAMAAMAPALPIFGDGEARLQPVYVDDVALALCAALERADAAGKTYELGGPRVYSFKDLLALTLSVVERKRLVVSIPFAVAPVVGRFGEIVGALPFVTAAITRDQITLLKSDNVVARGALGLSDLGVTPRTVEAIVSAYLYRYRKYGQFAERVTA